MERIIRIGVVGLLIALIGALVVPATAGDRTDRRQNRKIRKLQRQVRNLKERVTTIENAPDTTTGLADEIAAVREKNQEQDNRLDNHDNRLDNVVNNLNNWTNFVSNRIQQLDADGRYWGNINKDQVRLSQQEQGNCNLTASNPVHRAIWRYDSNDGVTRLDCDPSS